MPFAIMQRPVNPKLLLHALTIVPCAFLCVSLSPYCQFSGVGLIPWSPLARGFLTGKRVSTKESRTDAEATTRAKTDTFSDQLYFAPEDHEIAARVIELAEKRGVKPAQIALAWLLHKSAVSAPIIGASKMYQLEEAVAAIKIKLEKEELKFLEEKYKPHPVPGN
jgi:aryl-alcohol dehydrogenase-like predicted oxidoreductase